MKRQIGYFDEELEKRLDHTNFVVNSGTDLYIDNVDEPDEEAHGYGYNNPSDEAYGEMMVEESPNQYDINDTAYNKYIGAEVTMDVPG